MEITKKKSDGKKASAPVSSSERNNKALVAFLLFMMVVGFSAAGYFYWQFTDAQKNPVSSEQAAANRAQQLVVAVGKKMVLPKEETPTAVKIEDKSKLKDQPFFADAANGDFLLIYTQARKVIIYRESEDKIINVGPIAITEAPKTEKKTNE